MRQRIRSVLAGIALVVCLGATSAQAQAATYRVEDGDTLLRVAVRFGVTVPSLIAANGIGDADLLRIGQVLTIPGNGDEARAAPVSRGDRSAIRTFAKPARGPITTLFREPGSLWRLGYHPGLDIGAPIGDTISACGEGVVIEAESDGWNSGYGSYVKIDHGDGIQSLYGHMSVVLARVGDRVSPGSPIGRIGMTGHTTGPHVHWEVRVDGQIRDPLGYVP
jgi:murein DD-endopeptidase MepM/ murein hydrolase activator NlpD